MDCFSPVNVISVSISRRFIWSSLLWVYSIWYIDVHLSHSIFENHFLWFWRPGKWFVIVYQIEIVNIWLLLYSTVREHWYLTGTIFGDDVYPFDSRKSIELSWLLFWAVLSQLSCVCLIQAQLLIFSGIDPDPCRFRLFYASKFLELNCAEFHSVFVLWSWNSQKLVISPI